MILDVRRSLLVLLCVLGTWGCSGSSDDGVSGAPSTVVTVSRSSQAPDTSKPPYSEGTEIGRTYTYEFSSACTQTSLAIDRDYFIPEPWDALLAYFGSGSTPEFAAPTIWRRWGQMRQASWLDWKASLDRSS